MTETGLNSPVEAAMKLGISRASLFRLLRLGRMKTTRITPRKVFVAQSEIERLISARTK